MASLKEIFDREIRQIALQSDKDVQESFTRLQMSKSGRSDQPHPSDTLTSTIPCPLPQPPCPQPYLRANSPSCLTNGKPGEIRENAKMKIGIGGTHAHTLSLCDHETTLPSDGGHSTKYLRNNTGNVITPSSHFFAPNSQTPNVFIASPIDHHCTSGISESFPLNEECYSSSRFNLENGNTSPRDCNIVKNSLSLQFSGLNIRASQPSDQEFQTSVHRKKMRKSKAERCDRTLRVDELQKQNSAREGEESKAEHSSIIEEETEQITIGGDSQILVQGQDRSDIPPQESETTLNIYDDEVQFAVSGSKQARRKERSEIRKEERSEQSERRLPRWDDTNSETYSALKNLIQERAKSEVEVDRIKQNKDILFLHKQDAIRMANRFKRTINSLLDGQKDRFGQECDFQLREKCKSPNSSTTSGLHGRSVAMYNSTYTAGGNSSTKVAFDSRKYSTIGDYKRQERSCNSAAPTISASRYSSVEKEEQENRYSTASEHSFQEIERGVRQERKEEEEAYNPLQVDSVMNIQPGTKPQFQKKQDQLYDGPLSSPFELTMNQSNEGRNESLQVGGPHEIMSYQELQELRSSTARNKLLRSGSQYSFKTPTFQHQFRAQSSANSRGLSGSSYHFNRRQNSRKDGWQSLGNTLSRAQSAQLREPIQEEVTHRSPDLVREIDFLKSNERMLRQSLEAMTLQFHGKQRLTEELEEELTMKDERIVDLEGKLARANRKKLEEETENRKKVEDLKGRLRIAESSKNSFQEEVGRLNERLRERKPQKLKFEGGADEQHNQLAKQVQFLMDEVNKWSHEYEKCKQEKQEKERKLSEFIFLVENKSIELSKLHEVHQQKEMQFRENKIKLEADLRIMREHVSDLKTKLDVAHQQMQIKENECQSKCGIRLDYQRKMEIEGNNIEKERREKQELKKIIETLKGELVAAHKFQQEVETRFKQAAQLVQTQCEAQVRNEYEKIDSIKGAIIQEVQNYEVEIEKLKRENQNKGEELNDLKKVESNDSLIKAELEVTYREKLSESEKVITQLQQENQTLREEQDKLKNSVQNVKEESIRYESEVDELKAEHQKLREKLKQKKDKLKGERELHLREKENLNVNLKNVLEVTQKERVQSQLKSLDESKYLKEIQRLKINEISMRQRMKGMSEELSQLNSKCSSSTSQCKQLLEQMSTLKESKQELERSVSHYSTSIRSTRNELSRQEENQGYLLDTIAKYKADLVEKEERIVQMEGMLKSQRALSQEMKSMLHKQKMLSSMKEEKEEKLQQKVENLTAKLNKLEEQQAEKNRESHKLKIEYDELEIGYGHMKDKLVEENAKNNELEQENETLREQVGYLQNHVESLVELNKKNIDLREEKSVLMGELESKNQQCLHEYFEIFAEGKMDSILGEEEDLNERTFNMIPTKEH